MDREQRVGIVILVVAMATIVAMLWPLSDLPVPDDPEVEVLDDTLER